MEFITAEKARAITAKNLEDLYQKEMSAIFTEIEKATTTSISYEYYTISDIKRIINTLTKLKYTVEAKPAINVLTISWNIIKRDF